MSGRTASSSIGTSQTTSARSPISARAGVAGDLLHLGEEAPPEGGEQPAPAQQD
jgi:hypothetical protein